MLYPSPNPPSSLDQGSHQQQQQQQQQQQYATRREGVEVYVRGHLVPGLEMVVDEKGACVFADTGTIHPSPAALQSMLMLGEGGREGGGLLKEGANPVEFVYCNPYGDVSVEATFHLWGVRDRVVVSDIDGMSFYLIVLGSGGGRSYCRGGGGVACVSVCLCVCVSVYICFSVHVLHSHYPCFV
jgi:hypothetical protein